MPQFNTGHEQPKRPEEGQSYQILAKNLSTRSLGLSIYVAQAFARLEQSGDRQDSGICSDAIKDTRQDLCQKPKAATHQGREIIC